jgi:hypothetical protein
MTIQKMRSDTDRVPFSGVVFQVQSSTILPESPDFIVSKPRR